MRDMLWDVVTAAGKSPETAAQKAMRPVLPKRFYKQVSVSLPDPQTGKFSILLDGRAVKTPAKNLLALPNGSAAQLVANEWQDQKTEINPVTMPKTRLANTAIDGIALDPQAVIEDLLRFASNDLLSYRSSTPDSLVALQQMHWDPLLDWAAEELGSRFEVGFGITHIEQPKEAVANFSARLRNHSDPIRLACLHTLTSIAGSAIIALAIAEGFLSVDAAWKAAHVDEDYQISKWGEDYEAGERRKARLVEFTASVDLLKSI